MRSAAFFLVVIGGCTVDRFIPSSDEASVEPPAWEACDSHDPCISDDYCDASPVSQADNRCVGHAGECVHTPLDDGQDCFPTPAIGVGHCWKGTCQ